MAKLAKRYTGGPLSDYSQSFGGLKEFYGLQKPGATQHEQLQMQAHEQQTESGGFYRPGFEPKTGPLVPPTGVLRGTKLPPPNLDTGGAGETLTGQVDPLNSGGLVGGVFAKPKGMVPMAPTSQPAAPTFGPMGARPAGRSMTDPSRIVETMARGNRGDRQAQMAAAGFFAEQEAAPAKAAWEQYKFETTQGGIDRRADNTIKAQNDRAEAAAAARAGEQAVANNKWLAEESRRQNDYAQSLQPPGFLPVPGTTGGLIMQGNTAKTGFIPTDKPPVPGMMEFPGTKMAVPTINGARVPGLPVFEKTAPEQNATLPAPAPGMLSPGFFGGGQPAGSFGGSFADSPLTTPPPIAFTNPAQFKAVEAVKKTATKARMDLIKSMADLDALELKATGKDAKEQIQKMRKDLLADLNKNGVADVLEEGGGGGQAAPTPTPAPVVTKPHSAFLNSVGQ